MKRLDQTALDVEFLLISVIQGVALAELAKQAQGPLISLQVEAWPYIAGAFFIILIFWSGAIIHAISFVDWPIDLMHSFLYFLASLIEIITIANLTDPFTWCLFLFLFQLVGIVLYGYDYWLIKAHKKKFSTSIAKKKLFEHIVNGQKRAVLTFLPLSLIFNAVEIIAILSNKQLFIDENYHLIFIALQLIVGLAFLRYVLKNFRERSELIIAAEK